MDFSRLKLRLALSILLVGMGVALIYHGWQGWVLKRGFPASTFLFHPAVRYSDFTDMVTWMRTNDPYRPSDGTISYFPAHFLLFRPFTPLQKIFGATLFITAVGLGLFGLLLAAFRELVPHLPTRVLVVLPFLFSYPCLFGFDRANSEILLALLMGLSLLWYARKKFGLSFLALLVPVCFKLYPVALILLFVRRRLIRWAILMPVGFVSINWLALLTFSAPVSASLHSYLGEMRGYTNQMNLGLEGISASASAWNVTRIGVWTVRALAWGNADWPLPLGVSVLTLKGYYVGVLGLGLFLTFQVLLVERSFARRAILLLIYLTVSVPGGGNYKLMHVVTALVVLILIRERRPLDLAVVALLALAVVPLREVLLPYFGQSDTLARDCSLAVIVDPVCLLMAMGLLCWAGYREAWPLGFWQRVRKLGVGDFRRN